MGQFSVKIIWLTGSLLSGNQQKGKKSGQQEKSRRFLVGAGVREVGEAEEIRFVLESKYGSSAPDFDWLTHIADLNRFSDYLESHPRDVSVFRDYKVLRDTTGSPRYASEMFLDAPYMDTGARHYFERLEDQGRVGLSANYWRKIKKDKFINFASKLGVATQIVIEKTSCRWNPNRDLYYGGYGSRTSYERDIDYKIPYLSDMLAEPSRELSLVIWETISSAQVDWTEARYCRNYNTYYRTGVSQLAHVLRDNAWIPQESGEFVRPADASASKLPKGFKFDKGWDWLEEIGFGSEEKAALEQRKETERIRAEKNQRAQEFGFETAEDAELARELVANIPREKLSRLLAEEQAASAFEMPDKSSKNAERRAAKVADKARDAETRETEIRNRSVSLTKPQVKAEAAAYLQDQYTNADGVMGCQICKEPLPFLLADGSPYFEKVEFLKDLNLRHHQNYLALCPNHAAMFEHANDSKDILRVLLDELEGQELEIQLAQAETSIYFTQAHLIDLKAIIQSEAGEIDTST